MNSLDLSTRIVFLAMLLAFLALLLGLGHVTVFVPFAVLLLMPLVGLFKIALRSQETGDRKGWVYVGLTLLVIGLGVFKAL